MLRLPISLLLSMCFALPALAQFEYGELLGTVRDRSGAVVAGAKVTLRNLGTNIDRVGESNEAGNFSFPGLRVGSYKLRAEQAGFKIAETENLVLRVGDRLRADLTLEPGQISESITVESASSPLLETETSVRGQVIQGQLIRDLPLNKRDYTQLVLLVPGTTVQPAQRLGGAISINGNRSLQNNYLLDGADNNSNATSFRGERVDVIRPSVDAVEEFRVLTNSYSAEYGRSAGGVVNVSIKSGTNRFKGTLWEFFRNDGMDARGWTPTLGGIKPRLRYNQYGANIGGRIIKDKTFFFMNWEGERESQGLNYQGVVPTRELQQGIFSNTPAGLATDLRTLPVDPTTNQPFPDAIIPRSRFSRVSTRILGDPNFPVPTPTPLIPIPGTYISTRIQKTSVDKGDVRLDHYITSNWRLFGRYSYSDLVLFRPPRFLGFVEGSTNDGFGTTATKGHNGVIGSNITLTPSTILEVRGGVTRLNALVTPPNFGSASATELLGIPNLPASPQLNGGWPKLTFDGMDALGRHTSTPQYQIPTVILTNANLSMVRGNHNIRTGFDYQNIFTPILDVSAPIGRFEFRRNIWTNNPWGDFLLGLPSAYAQTTPTVIYNKKTLNGFFAQDDWKIRRNLTLNLGVRYEYGTPLREKFDRIMNFDLRTGQQIYPNTPGAISDALIQADRDNFSPRIGFAWTVMPKLVVRSGYGIFYNFTNRQGREGLLGQNPPFLRDLFRGQSRTTVNPITLDSGPPANFFATALPSDQLLRANDVGYRDGYVQQWNFTLQYSVAKDWVFEVGYVGNRGNNLTRFLNANQALVPGTPATLPQRRPYTQYADIQYMDSGGASKYHSLQTRVEKRFSRGLSLLHSFTYARGMENVSSWNDPNGNLAAQDARNFRNEWGLGNNVIKFVSVTNWIYELPFGKGRQFLSNANWLADGILGGWQFGGIFNWRSGLPLTIFSNQCGECAMGDRVQRANVVAGVSSALDNPSASQWFNRAAYIPVSNATGPFGTAGRNTEWGPRLANWDLTFTKNFRLSESRYFQFRGELFNAFNSVNLNQPNNNASGGAGFGVITSAQAGRSIQLGLKLYY